MEVKCGVPKFSNPYQYNIVLGYCFGNMSKYQNFASVIRWIYIYKNRSSYYNYIYYMFTYLHYIWVKVKVESY